MVTASHNPAEYNGCKAVGKNMTWIRGTEIGEMVEQDTGHRTQDECGTCTEADLYPQYLEHIKKAIDIDTSRPMKILVDAGNGMAGKVIPLLQPLLPSSVTIELMFAELDGHFPNRPSNPLMAGAADAAGAKVREMNATAGFMFDGDTDRLFTLDESGKLIRGDQTLLLLAKEALRQEPGTAIAYNLICSKAVAEFVAKWGGVPVRTPVGYVNVSAGLRAHKGKLSGEVSSHFSFRENAYADSGFLAFIYILNLLSRETRPLSELIGEITPYVRGDEVNFTHSNIPAALASLKAKYADGQQDELDGLTVQYPTWWFNARPSNTEPLLRITLEANTAEEQKQKEDEVVAAAKAAE
jgi:phosphomannomutase